MSKPVMDDKGRLHETVCGEQPAVFHGICSTCIHARTCRGALNAPRPVQFCDLFETNEVPESREMADRAVEKQDGGEDETRLFKGLCINCECRHQCVHARSPGGVWHCEEYR